MVAIFFFSPRMSSFRAVTFSKHFSLSYTITMRARAAKTRWETESAGNRTFFTLLPSHGKKARSFPFPRAMPLSSPCPFLCRERPSLSPTHASLPLFEHFNPRESALVLVSVSLSLSLSLSLFGLFDVLLPPRTTLVGEGRTRGESRVSQFFAGDGSGEAPKD